MARRAMSWAAAVVVAVLAATAGQTIHRFLLVTGVFRRPSSTLVPDSDFRVIEDTAHCEDLHYHASGNVLFAACQDDEAVRFKWFPPLTVFDDPELALRSQGSIHVIDAKTAKSQRLTFENFKEPFHTHGIDVIADPRRPDAVYVFAVNHLPHPDYVKQVRDSTAQGKAEVKDKARSQVELFHHVLGSSSIRHVRSIRHKLMKTPNDIVATSPRAFFVTNDHRYREGPLRQLEEAHFGAGWSDTVHVWMPGRRALQPAHDPTDDVIASTALTGLHNNNGLAHGRDEDEVVVMSTISGVLNLARISPDPVTETIKLRITESVRLDSLGDNPSYFADPFAATPHGNQSGFVVPGLSRAWDLPGTIRDEKGTLPLPAMVWFVQQTANGKWNKRVIFEDDGLRIRSASGAVLVAINPAEEETAQRKAWLYVTGFHARNMIAVKVNLTESS